MANEYTNLPVVATEDERDGHLTIGVMIDDVFVPIAQHKLGHIENFAERAAELGITVAKSEVERVVEAIDKRVAALEPPASSPAPPAEQPAAPQE